MDNHPLPCHQATKSQQENLTYPSLFALLLVDQPLGPLCFVMTGRLLTKATGHLRGDDLVLFPWQKWHKTTLFIWQKRNCVTISLSTLLPTWQKHHRSWYGPSVGLRLVSIWTVFSMRHPNRSPFEPCTTINGHEET